MKTRVQRAATLLLAVLFCAGLLVPAAARNIDYEIFLVKTMNLKVRGNSSAENIQLNSGGSLRLAVSADDFEWYDTWPEPLTAKVLRDNDLKIAYEVTDGYADILDVYLDNTIYGVDIVVDFEKVKSDTDFSFVVFFERKGTKISRTQSPTITGTVNAPVWNTASRPMVGAAVLSPATTNNNIGSPKKDDRPQKKPDVHNPNLPSYSIFENQNAPKPLKRDDAVGLIEDEIAAGVTTVSFNDVSELSLSTARAMQAAAKGHDVTVRFSCMKNDGRNVDVRLTVSLADISKTVDLSGSTVSDYAKELQESFSGWYPDHKISAVHLGQDGDYGMTVKVAFKPAEPVGGGPVLYRYDSDAKTYHKLDAVPSTDSNGYLHFSVTQGGDYIITDKQLS